MTLTREQLLAGIARHAPWYQRIEFPEHGISTTDDPANALLDAAWDNKTDDITLEQAAQFRPQPKWRCIQKVLPSPLGLDVLEVGCNCGFFTFEFAKLGARSVTGIDVAPDCLERAEWARGALGLDNVRFLNCDFMRYDGGREPAPGLLSRRDNHIPLPDGLCDLVIMSTVLDHMFFPLFAIYKMCRISRRWVVIDGPVAAVSDSDKPLARLDVVPGNLHHGITFTLSFMVDYIARLGIPRDDIQVHPYNNSHNVTYVINVRRLAVDLYGA